MPPLDVPTEVALIIFVILIVAALYVKWGVPAASRQGAFLAIAGTVWLIATVLGEFVTGWATTQVCSPYLQCNDGFFGYDAVEHFVCGIAAAFALLWLSRKLPEWSVVSSRSGKTILNIIAYVALMAVSWEILECAIDVFRVDGLHEHLVNLRLHINLLEQSSNLDTMGDMTFALIGSCVGMLTARFFNRTALRTSD